MKILLVLNALEFKKEQVKYPAYLAKHCNGQITALFIENLVQVAIPMSKYGHMGGIPIPGDGDAEAKKETIDKNVELYKEACHEAGISYEVIRTRSIPLEKTIEASRFADLLFIAADQDFDMGPGHVIGRFVEDVLTDAQCPVLVMPNKQKEIKELIFAYNGSYSSVYAIKQFTHLFPGFKNKPVTVLYVDDKADDTVTHRGYITDYLQQHYDSVNFSILKGTPDTAIFAYLLKESESIVTLGAYGRSKLSQFFKKSKAENILKNLDLPVFITHP